MFIIGITGGIGSGKSTVADLCREAGLHVLDADVISREVTEAGGIALPEITESFGSAILNDKGGLDRVKMARLVFSNKKKLDQLSSIIHRHVIGRLQEKVEQLNAEKTKAVVLDVPIPVRHGFLDLCDQVWLVWAEENIRIRRLAGRGMPEEEALRRMRMQMTKEEYQKLSDREIDNSLDLGDLRLQVNTLLQQELTPRGIRFRALINENGTRTDVREERQ